MKKNCGKKFLSQGYIYIRFALIRLIVFGKGWKSIPNLKMTVIVFDIIIELVFKELNQFGVIAGLFWQIGGVIVVDLCSFALFEDFSL